MFFILLHIQKTNRKQGSYCEYAIKIPEPLVHHRFPHWSDIYSISALKGIGLNMVFQTYEWIKNHSKKGLRDKWKVIKKENCS